MAEGKNVNDHFLQGEDDNDDDYQDIGDLDFLINSKQQQQQQQQEEDEVEDEEEEQVLSQKLSKLSTSNEPSLKKMKTQYEDDEEDDDDIPIYLSRENKSFMDMIEQEQWLKNNTMNSIEDLHQIAILKHKLAVNELQRELWLTYVKSGTGRLEKAKSKDASVTTKDAPHIWPVKVKAYILSKRATTDNMNAEEEDTLCLHFTNQFICNLNEKNVQYQSELNKRQNMFSNYTDAIDKGLQTYIEQQRMYFLRLKYELKRKLIDCNYQEQLFQMQYRQQNPNEYQQEIAQRLYQLTYNLEDAKQQVSLLKQRISHDQPPKSFDSFNLSLPTTFQTIHDPTLRQRLFDRHEKILQQTQTDMMAVMISGAEAIQRQYQKDVDNEIAKVWQDNRQLSHDQRMTLTMSNLINERLENVAKRIQAIYNFKIQYFFFQAPTVVNKNINYS